MCRCTNPGFPFFEAVLLPNLLLLFLGKKRELNRIKLYEHRYDRKKLIRSVEEKETLERKIVDVPPA
jgi:hypothetical protein